MQKTILIAVLSGLAVSAQASSILSLGSATGFDVFTLGDFTAAGTDAQGRVAVGGDFIPRAADRSLLAPDCTMPRRMSPFLISRLSERITAAAVRT
jgi:hypothetical protein